jgi:hypothetical protein
MRDVANHGTAILDIRKMNVQPDDKCIFTFGEIDLRCDMKHAVMVGASEIDVIIDLVRRYLDVLRLNEMEGVDFWLMEVLPTAYYNVLPVTVRDHPIFPYIGSDEERVWYTSIMNRELIDQGTLAGYHILHVHHRYADDVDMMRPELAAYMHVADNGPILAEMHAAGLYGDEEAKTKIGLAAVSKWAQVKGNR